MSYTTKELDSSTWPDFSRLAEKQGGCWCIYYQRPRPLSAKLSREDRVAANKSDKRSLVKAGRSHAIIVYSGKTPAGWCQYGTQDELPRIDAGRNYKKLEKPGGRLWRITCFFVDKRFRGQGVSKAGLHAVMKSIERKGGGVVEAYPVVSQKMAAVPEWRWFGTPGMFEKEGFKRVAPLGTSLVLMRKSVASRPSS